MKLPGNVVRILTIGVFFLLGGNAIAADNAYPNRAIRFVIPYPPGGGTDITGRIMARALSEELSQPVVLENRPGATGMIGADVVVKARPDGYTVLFGAASEMAINASLFRNMAYNPRSDLVPVSLVATFPLVFVTAAGNQGSLTDLIRQAKAQPNSVSFGSIGQGSPQHLAGELLSTMASAQLLHVPYKGSGPLVQDAVAGHVSMAISSVPPAVPLVEAGKLRALAVTSATRLEVMPDVPTVAELGFPGYDFGTWVGMSVPVGTPQEVILRLQEATARALAHPSVRAALRDQGAVPVGSSPEKFRSFIESEIAKSDQIVARASVHLD
ncbi:MAG: tripartite tricarboxylate transporter substrate binding protein [Burkholderiales bacterium]